MSKEEGIPTDAPPPYSPPEAGWNLPQSKAAQYAVPAPQPGLGGPSVYYPANAQAPVGGPNVYYAQTTQPVGVYPAGSTVVSLNSFGREKVRMTCPFCTKEISTSVDRKPSMKAYIASAVICFLGCYLGCCLIPCCIDDCMSVEHRCPNCDKYLGRYEA